METETNNTIAIDAGWAGLAAIVNDELYSKIWHMAVTEGSDSVIDYLIFQVKRGDVVRYWYRSGLSTAYDFTLDSDPFYD